MLDHGWGKHEPPPEIVTAFVQKVRFLENLNQMILQNLGVLIVVLSVVAFAALALAIANFTRTRAVLSRFAWITKQSNEDTPDSLATLLNAVKNNARTLDELRVMHDDAVQESHSHFKRVGLVRYDAFDGVAGQQSYSLCLLNERRNGVLISSLVGSNFSRGYAIEIKSGEAARKLGEEEKNALVIAVSDKAA